MSCEYCGESSWEGCDCEEDYEAKPEKLEVNSSEIAASLRTVLVEKLGLSQDKAESAISLVVGSAENSITEAVRSELNGLLAAKAKEIVRERTADYLEEAWNSAIESEVMVLAGTDSKVVNKQLREIINERVKQFFNKKSNSRYGEKTLESALSKAVDDRVQEALDEIKREAIDKFNKEAMKKMMHGMAKEIADDKKLLSLLS